MLQRGNDQKKGKRLRFASAAVVARSGEPRHDEVLLSLQGSPQERVGMVQLVHGSHRRNKQLFMHS